MRPWQSAQKNSSTINPFTLVIYESRHSTFSTMTLSITPFIIMTLSIMVKNNATISITTLDAGSLIYGKKLKVYRVLTLITQSLFTVTQPGCIVSYFGNECRSAECHDAECHGTYN